ncbi:hypothetical protein FQZ97_1124210 [compost metagenome]
MLAGEQSGRLLQVVVAAEEGQVVAGTFLELPGHEVADGRQGGGAMLVAGGYPGADPHVQLFRAEGGIHFQPGRVRRQAQQVAVVVTRREGGGEQHGGATGGEPGAEEGRRYQVAQAQA